MRIPALQPQHLCLTRGTHTYAHAHTLVPSVSASVPRRAHSGQSSDLALGAGHSAPHSPWHLGVASGGSGAQEQGQSGVAQIAQVSFPLRTLMRPEAGDESLVGPEQRTVLRASQSLLRQGDPCPPPGVCHIPPPRGPHGDKELAPSGKQKHLVAVSQHRCRLWRPREDRQTEACPGVPTESSSFQDSSPLLSWDSSPWAQGAPGPRPGW